MIRSRSPSQPVLMADSISASDGGHCASTVTGAARYTERTMNTAVNTAKANPATAITTGGRAYIMKATIAAAVAVLIIVPSRFRSRPHRRPARAPGRPPRVVQPPPAPTARTSSRDRSAGERHDRDASRRRAGRSRRNRASSSRSRRRRASEKTVIAAGARPPRRDETRTRATGPRHPPRTAAAGA